jgi:hypothetical protein
MQQQQIIRDETLVGMAVRDDACPVYAEDDWRRAAQGLFLFGPVLSTAVWFLGVGAFLNLIG